MNECDAPESNNTYARWESMVNIPAITGSPITPSMLRPKPSTKSCHEHHVCVTMHVIEGVDKFLVA